MFEGITNNRNVAEERDSRILVATAFLHQAADDNDLAIEGAHHVIRFLNRAEGQRQVEILAGNPERLAALHHLAHCGMDVQKDILVLVNLRCDVQGNTGKERCKNDSRRSRR